VTLCEIKKENLMENKKLKEEVENLQPQNVIVNISSKSRVIFYAFREYDAIHIVHYLKSFKVKQMSIFVTRAFI